MTTFPFLFEFLKTSGLKKKLGVALVRIHGRTVRFNG